MSSEDRGPETLSPPSRPRNRAVLVFCALTTAATCAFVVMIVPRPVIPREPRALSLEEAEIEAVMVRDATLREQAVPQTSIHALFRSHGHAELYRDESPGDAAQREQAIRITLSELERQVPDARSVLRARAASDLEATLAAAQPDEELVGGFLDVIDRLGLPVHGGRRDVRFAVRTLFKARWNAIAGAAPTDGLAPVEVRAYYGVLAFEAREAAPDLRLARLVDYERETGTSEREMRAYLHFTLGETRAAQAIYEELYGATGQARYRNHALAAIEVNADE